MEVKRNPKAGLPKLNAILQGSTRKGKQQICNSRSDLEFVPLIFELLPNAIQSVGDTPKPLAAACAVIEHCVTLYNDSMLNNHANGTLIYDTAIGSDNPKKCVEYLAEQFKKIAHEARAKYKSYFCNDLPCSKMIRSIMLATSALLAIDGHGTECAEALGQVECVEACISALEDNSGLDNEAKAAVAGVLSLLLEKGDEDTKRILACRPIRLADGRWLPLVCTGGRWLPMSRKGKEMLAPTLLNGKPANKKISLMEKEI